MKKMFVIVAAAVCGVSLLAVESKRIVITQETDHAVGALVSGLKLRLEEDTLKAARSVMSDFKMLVKYGLSLQRRGMSADQLQNDQKLLVLNQKFAVAASDFVGKMIEDLQLNSDSDAVLEEIACVNDRMNEILSKLDSEITNDLQRGDLLLLLADCVLKHLDN